MGTVNAVLKRPLYDGILAGNGMELSLVHIINFIGPETALLLM
jgi:hypothetical protein